MNNLKTLEQAQQIINKKFPNKLTLTEYTHARGNCTFKCNTCGSVHTRCYQTVLSHGICPTCFQRQRVENIKQKGYKIHNHQYEYIKVDKTHVQYMCKHCNKKHTQSIKAHINDTQGCPRCNKPHGATGQLNYGSFIRNPKSAEEPGTFYIIKLTNNRTGEVYHKYGCTKQKLCKRLMNIRHLSECVIEVIHQEHGTMLDMFHIETQFRKNCSNHYTPLKRWWGSNECFLGDWQEVLNECEKKLKKSHLKMFQKFF